MNLYALSRAVYGGDLAEARRLLDEAAKDEYIDNPQILRAKQSLGLEGPRYTFPPDDAAQSNLEAAMREVENDTFLTRWGARK